MNETDLQLAKQDHAYVMGAIAGLNAATEPPCFHRKDRPQSTYRKEFEAALERRRQESLHVMVTERSVS